ncbi:hypothetical protein [Flavobacterium psychrotrophum]|uniref:hypothetical protein n=1 Tax=Flavobacterium psychrotrophum TaxID=2294119 RepID=UPI000E323CFB|nr:hypothetical protein [Flavobacterium psychrotrophum]
MQHTIEIPELKLMLYLPQNLAQCDAAQYIEMCGLLYRYHTHQLSYYDLKVQAVYKLLDLKQSKKTLFVNDEQDKWCNVYSISQLVESFFDNRDGQKVINLDFIHNPVPKQKPLWRNYYGPADGFANVTFGEYLDAQRLFLDFSATGNGALLYDLAAILYRSKKRPLGKRRAYDSETVEARATTFKYCPDGFIYGVFLLFAAFQKYLATAVIPWAGKELELSILFDAGDSDRMEAVPGLGMDGLAFALAESNVFGDFKAVRATNLWEVLLQLYNLKKNDLDTKLNDKSK